MHIELNVMALNPTKFTEPLLECWPELPDLRIVFILERNQNADLLQAVGPLRARRKGPCHHRTAEKCYEFAPPHVCPA